jgi:hypothetical protein
MDSNESITGEMPSRSGASELLMREIPVKLQSVTGAHWADDPAGHE